MLAPSVGRLASRGGVFGANLLVAVLLLLQEGDLAGAAFVNFETAPLHPVALSPDGQMLAVCNLPDGRVELFDVSTGVPLPAGSVPVGIDPVSVRFRDTNELWVVNFISSSVNVVDVARKHVAATLSTIAGPADVIFAGMPKRAFVSCARSNTVMVFDPNTRACFTNIAIDGDRPKAMAASPDGSKVYVAIFESGNASTIVAGRENSTNYAPVFHPAGPYGGVAPVPNDGMNLRPPLYLNPNVDPFWYQGYPVSQIVKRNGAGRWMDDNNGDWTEFISGTNSALAGRVTGWDMADHDLAIINTTSYGVSYATGLMNICMDLAVNPVSGRISVVGTDGTNERRFEPNLRGTFIRVNLALVDPVTVGKTVMDLNPHLDYSTATAARSLREKSIGDPRGIIWNSAGTHAFVTGMGSRNLVVIDASGSRIGDPIEVGEGPTGLALDEARQRLYVLNRFSASISVLETPALTLVTNVAFFDPTPPVIKAGRKHLYDTRQNSGLGQASCGSCHVDARFDRLAWDLGNPAADIGFLIVEFPPNPSIKTFFPFHPMKGPLVTQTLQDIIGSEPLHWRGDRPDIESFNVTFTDLLARELALSSKEMQEFKDFLATIHFPPNPFRNFDNSLPTNVPLPGFFGVNEEGIPDRTPLPNGNAEAGSGVFGLQIEDFTTCLQCHSSTSGRGRLGDEGELPLLVRDSRPLKLAQLRSIPDKLGMDKRSTSSRAGFGLRFDGREDTITSFLEGLGLSRIRESPDMNMNQTIADLTAFLLAFSGDGFDKSRPGFQSRDAVAAVGRQITLSGPGGDPLVPAMMQLITNNAPGVELVAKGRKDDLARGWFLDFETFTTVGRFQSDRASETITLNELLALASPNAPLTFTVVAAGTGRRIGIDRDGDGFFDRTELDLGFDPANPASPLGRIVSISKVAGTVTLVWESAPGAAYAIEWSTNLPPSDGWAVIQPSITANSTTSTYVDSPANDEQRFYRVRLDLQQNR